LNTKIRILVVDGSRLTPWLVRSLTPPRVLVEHASSFSEAMSVLSIDPPDGAVFNITPADVPWRALAEACRRRRPPIPFLWCASLPREHLEDALEVEPDEPFLARPIAVAELRRELESLLQRAERGASKG
jgi:hypothetical protein